jgi:hypothetical protein
MKRFRSFFSWFIRCQNICIEDKKLSPKIIDKKKFKNPIAV